MNCIIYSFISVAIKIAILVSWCTQLQCLCANLMICSLKFKKDVLILKMLLWIVCFGFEAIPHPSCYKSSVADNTQHGLVIALFSTQLLQIF